MQAVHVLVDLENNQPTLEDVKRLVPDVTHVWLFHSPNQVKRLASFEPMGDRCTPVPISRPGKNALDFHLTFYVGYLAARNPDAKLVVVAIDRGYGPMIEHAVDLDLRVAQVAFKPLAKPARKAATKPVPAGAVRAAGAGGTPATKSAAKKAQARKVPTKKAPAKKVAAKKAPAKTAPSRSAAQQKVAPKKAAAKPAVAGKVKAAGQPTPPTKAAATKKPALAKQPTAAKKAGVSNAPAKGAPAARPASLQASPKAAAAKVGAPAATAKRAAPGKSIGVDKVIVNLRKVAAGRRPKKLKQLRGHLSSLLGTGAEDGKVTSLLNNLLAADVVRLNGDTVVYGRAVGGADA
ncbi:MAG: hypothetical protein KIT17_19830 [Rubrivivax sp.]|nr:hypothetical protein [Rubrivivax sp.]